MYSILHLLPATEALRILRPRASSMNSSLRRKTHNTFDVLLQMEVLMNPDCKSQVRRITVNGATIPFIWANYDRFIALKFTQLTGAMPKPYGATLCWYVSPSECAQPSIFCYKGSCQDDSNVSRGRGARVCPNLDRALQMWRQATHSYLCDTTLLKLKNVSAFLIPAVLDDEGVRGGREAPLGKCPLALGQV
ncbi:hypothetical protein VOLCADRAFT_98453 [Volvox carteri f. nagariensis]|uniref:Pherophorin domain-containing protein n=1 Tax=Volvox carteri f. nagariensis TaxID=3068 RepID=D8UFD6_VOLCA|nr:uncharacterized protein VOLCADRAFT_98453 [Volvox carteri f. nagariensis]EFJ41590.1 hypothetical protein VOLCADRAFT_98453 [Volvox carteri f. nagariensis]|eukprot:XP_002957381.1 hypothetical protein VOLCADRAFT_98453 [Volvox carteri f. nagariensis]